MELSNFERTVAISKNPVTEKWHVFLYKKDELFVYLKDATTYSSLVTALAFADIERPFDQEVEQISWPARLFAPIHKCYNCECGEPHRGNEKCYKGFVYSKRYWDDIVYHDRIRKPPKRSFKDRLKSFI